MTEPKNKKHPANEEAILSAVMNAQRHGGAEVSDVDAVAGASLGVEGIIELGRKTLEAKKSFDK